MDTIANTDLPLHESIARLLGQHTKTLLSVALDGAPPLKAALDLLEASEVDAVPPSAVLAAAEGEVAALMHMNGLHPFRQLVIQHKGETVSTSLYYRPGQEEVFKALRQNNPILAVVTNEPQRFARAIIDRCRQGLDERPVLVWTSASGLYEVEGAGRHAIYHPICRAERKFANATVTWNYLSAGAPPEHLEAARSLLEAHPEWEQMNLFLPTRAVKVFVQAGIERIDQRKSSLTFVVDDESDEGAYFSPLEASEEAELVEQVREKIAATARVRNHERNADFRTLNFGAVLAHLIDDPVQDAVVILFDGQLFLGSNGGERAAINARALKDAYYRLRKSDTGVKIVIFSSSADLSTDLREEVQRIELPLPNRHELEAALRERIGQMDLPEALLDRGPQGFLTRLVDSAAGMTIGEIRAVVECYADTASTDPAELVEQMHEAKKNSVARSPALEVIEQHDLPDTALGGLGRLTDWLDARRKIFERPEAARAVGIDRRPKGVLLLGIPGTGKSLAAKVVAKRWGLPLLRLDMGAIQNKYVGASEERIRDALRTVTAMAPCVLWIDEIDKGMGQGENHGIHSTDSNIRATLLTWMQEYREPVFVIATANQISVLPPELMRAGRFDARFFLGCPGPQGRHEILRIHMSKRRIRWTDLDIDALVAATHGYTGAEIEQLVLDVLYDVFNEDETGKPTMEHFRHRLAHTQPLVKTIGAPSADGRRRGALDEVWNLIEEGRVEFASDDLLTRAQLAKLIDPLLYRPVYCRRGGIGGFEKLHTMGERLAMTAPMGTPSAVVLDCGDPEWLYVQTNVRFDQLDEHTFCFIDRFSTIENNGVMDTLINQQGIEQIVFAEPHMRERVTKSEAWAQYEDLFQNAWE